MAKRQVSAKDRAFEKERSQFRKALREQERQCTELRIATQRIKELETTLAEKEDWIERLLNYMDLSPEELEQRKKGHLSQELENAIWPITQIFERMFHI